MGSLLLEDYIVLHLKYVNPEESILYDDNIQLMALSKTHAWFSIMPNDENTNKYPFVSLTNFGSLKKFLLLITKLCIQLPKNVVHQLGNVF